MEVLYILIPVSVVLAAAFTVACLRAIRQGQFDDLESPRWRILFEGSAPRTKGAEKVLVPEAEAMNAGVETPNAGTRRSESA